MGNRVVTIAVPLAGRGDRRAAERIPAEMPVSIEGRDTVTTDLSATGVSFIAQQRYEIGAQVDLVIEYLLDGHHYPLECSAEVVRVRPVEGGYAIGARLARVPLLADIGEPTAGEGLVPD